MSIFTLMITCLAEYTPPMPTASDIFFLILIVAFAAVLTWYYCKKYMLFLPIVCAKIGGSTPKTYRIDSEWITDEMWERNLPGWTRVYGNDADLTYADSTHYSDKKLYDVRARLKYRLNCKNLMDKAKLHNILGAEAPETICRTILTDEKTQLPAGVWMIRLNVSSEGKNAVAVDNQKAFNKLRNKWKPKTKYEKENAVIMASEYIMNPLLYKDRKFHIRLYMVVGVLPERRAWLITEGLIIPAKLPYEAKKWNNPAIHDTHGKNNPTIEPITPQSHPEWFDRCTQLLSRVMAIMLPRINKYDEADAAYELFGADVMLTDDGQTKLIEVNSLPNISKNDPRLNDTICAGIVASAIHARFPGDAAASGPVIPL